MQHAFYADVLVNVRPANPLPIAAPAQCALPFGLIRGLPPSASPPAHGCPEADGVSLVYRRPLCLATDIRVGARGAGLPGWFVA